MVFGIDEVGRGCWAGPLVVAAVALDEEIPGLNDSKKLSKKQRSELRQHIVSNTNNIITISSIKPHQVDQLGLSEAMRLACQELFSSISKLNYDTVIIDGNVNYLEGERDTIAVVGADGSNQACMAASIIAKEFRDAYMTSLAEKYPEYGFEKHVGYGTQAHKEALEKHGPTDAHRLSFQPVRRIAEQWADR